VDVFKELVVDFARKWDAKVIVKGLRVISDFEWELQMNQLNRTLAPDIETVYVMASPEVSFVSSSGVKEIAAYGGDVDELVPEAVAERWIVKERQEMLAEAKRECDRILGEAREQAVREASQTEIVKLAERQAQDIIDEARRSARETRLEMEDWADSILSTLEVNLDKFLGAVKRGRERLHERSQETVVAGIAAPGSTNDDQPYQ
jgi:hypothetical protein